MAKKTGNKKDLIFKYTFKFQDDSEKHFSISLDEKSLLLIPSIKETIPDWARLDFCPCPNCPFSIEEKTYCPIAENLVDLINFFNNAVSYERVQVTIETNERTYMKNTSLQDGVSSLLGIYMTTSGCPVMDKLKPMVKFHLPFASIDETFYRAISMYLFSQLLRFKKGMSTDWELKGLVEIYKQVRKVNDAFCKRIKKITNEDANINALVILDNFANYIKFSIDMDMIYDFEHLFEMYLD